MWQVYCLVPLVDDITGLGYHCGCAYKTASKKLHWGAAELDSSRHQKDRCPRIQTQAGMDRWLCRGSDNIVRARWGGAEIRE